MVPAPRSTANCQHPCLKETTVEAGQSATPAVCPPRFPQRKMPRESRLAGGPHRHQPPATPKPVSKWSCPIKNHAAKNRTTKIALPSGWRLDVLLALGFGFSCLTCVRKISVIVPAFNEEKLLGTSLTEMKSAAANFHPRGWPSKSSFVTTIPPTALPTSPALPGRKSCPNPANQNARTRNTGPPPPLRQLAGVCGRRFASQCRTFCRPWWNKFFSAAVLPVARPSGWMNIFCRRYHHAAVELCQPVAAVLAGSVHLCQGGDIPAGWWFHPELFAAEELDLSKRLNGVCQRNRQGNRNLHRHPLRTSARKIKLSRHETLCRLMSRLFNQRRNFTTSREEAHLWDDGRR